MIIMLVLQFTEVLKIDDFSKEEFRIILVGVQFSRSLLTVT